MPQKNAPAVVPEVNPGLKLLRAQVASLDSGKVTICDGKIFAVGKHIGDMQERVFS